MASKKYDTPLEFRLKVLRNLNKERRKDPHSLRAGQWAGLLAEEDRKAYAKYSRTRND